MDGLNMIACAQDPIAASPQATTSHVFSGWLQVRQLPCVVFGSVAPPGHRINWQKSGPTPLIAT
jgi:hypothetical protein